MEVGFGGVEVGGGNAAVSLRPGEAVAGIAERVEVLGHGEHDPRSGERKGGRRRGEPG